MDTTHMYTTQQLLHGLRNPSSISKEIKLQFRKHTHHGFGVQGSYESGNIGDRALGEIFQEKLTQQGYQTELFNRNVKDSNTPNRVLGGGGVLHDWYGVEHLKNRLEYVSGGDRGYLVGIGVPGFTSQESKELIKRTLPELDLITVRDEWSKKNLDFLSGTDVSVTACPAFLHEDPNENVTEKTGVNFRPYFSEADKSDEVLKTYFGYVDLDGAEAAYLENIKRICDMVENPVYIPFHKNDELFARTNLDIPVFEYNFSVEETLKRVSSVKKMVTMRYHSLIFAAICGKEVLSIGYEPKVESVAERLDIPTYKPHKHIPLKFTDVSNVGDIRQHSQTNFDLLYDLVD